MPAEGVHLTGLREAAASPGLASTIRRALTRWDDAGRLGAVALDLAYFDHYAEEVARYALKLAPRSSPWGDHVHERFAVEILRALVASARATRSERVAAVALGVASHIALDRQLHPLINALARRFAGLQSHAAAHREVEKFQSICFHERYFGEDRMGGPGIVRLVQVPMRELFATDEVADALAGAFAVLPGGGPGRAALTAMGRGYEQHAILLGSPLGKTLARPADKERARPQFLFGPWGRFEALLERAVARSVDALEAVWAAISATNAEREAADRTLAVLLPTGTIDPDGLDVNLDQPFVPMLARAEA